MTGGHLGHAIRLIRDLIIGNYLFQYPKNKNSFPQWGLEVFLCKLIRSIHHWIFSFPYFDINIFPNVLFLLSLFLFPSLFLSRRGITYTCILTPMCINNDKDNFLQMIILKKNSWQDIGSFVTRAKIYSYEQRLF